tara:strand:- start:16 stop:192 length:177 start_codon:yes stop_codon:yes gene_type:complete
LIILLTYKIMKTNFLILVLLILSACQNIENGKKITFPKKEKENSINMNATISEIEIKN